MRHTAADYHLFTLNSEVALGSRHPQHFEKQRNFKFEVNKRQSATLQCTLYYNSKTEARRGRECIYMKQECSCVGNELYGSGVIMLGPIP